MSLPIKARQLDVSLFESLPIGWESFDLTFSSKDHRYFPAIFISSLQSQHQLRISRRCCMLRFCCYFLTALPWVGALHNFNWAKNRNAFCSILSFELFYSSTKQIYWQDVSSNLWEISLGRWVIKCAVPSLSPLTCSVWASWHPPCPFAPCCCAQRLSVLLGALRQNGRACHLLFTDNKPFQLFNLFYLINIV